MKTLKIEPFSGISGDMTLGALIDLGAPGEMLVALPGILGFTDVSITISEIQKCGICCTKVTIFDQTKPVTRHLGDIVEMIERADLHGRVKSLAGQIFTLLGEAEAAVHGIPVEKVHFHEVGAVDSILDIVGAALLLNELDYEQVVLDPVCTGSGFVRCDHGKFPVPAPATELLLQGMPTFAGDISAEMTTPTGAAILKALTPGFSTAALRINASGYGAGERDFENQPNCLRISLGETDAVSNVTTDQVIVIQANLDDISGELLGNHFQDRLLAGGALDVCLSALIMKKGRPGHRLEILCREADRNKLTEVILTETTTIGVRYWSADRVVLARTEALIDTRFGEIRLKCVTLPNGTIRRTPEYEDCRRCATASGATLQEVMHEANRLSEQADDED